MAPRGRPRGVGNTRMDAAIDALKPMGFLPDVIRKKVRELLEVYGGPEGWAFIEEASYKLLIDSILEDQENEKCALREPNLLEDQEREKPGESAFEDWQNETRGQGADVEPSEAGPLFLADRPSCSEHVHLSPKTVPELPFLRPAQTLIPTVIDMQDVQRQIAVLLDTCEHSAPPGFEQLPRQQHRPCLGWIGPKDDDDFVLLEPMPVEGEEERRRARGKLKSRWDEKPDDVV